MQSFQAAFVWIMRGRARKNIIIRPFQPRNHQQVLEMLTKGYNEMWLQAYLNTLNATKLWPIFTRMVLLYLAQWIFSGFLMTMVFSLTYETWLAYFVIYRAYFNKFARYWTYISVFVRRVVIALEISEKLLLKPWATHSCHTSPRMRQMYSWSPKTGQTTE